VFVAFVLLFDCLNTFKIILCYQNQVLNALDHHFAINALLIRVCPKFAVAGDDMESLVAI
jgi:hypothetical protein